MVAYVFPGQGSQSIGMGKELFKKYPELTNIADEVLGYSVEDICLKENDNLNNTRYTQPVLYVVSALSYLNELDQTGVMPDYVAGHSLGEYNALFAAGVVDFKTGLMLVKKRGELMAQAYGGGMAAVIGFTEYEVKDILKKNRFDEIYVANYNSPKQIVISGMKDDIVSAKEIFENAGCRLYSILNVSGAFHSRYMMDAQKQFEEYLDNFTLKAPKIPLISNITARPCSFKEMKYNLINQITNSVRWTDTVRFLLGIDSDIEIKQIGPGNVLTGLTARIKREATPLKCGLDGKKLGDAEFKKKFNLDYACMSGAMYRGIASADMVIRMAKVKMMGIFGTGGLSLNEIEENICKIQKALSQNETFGCNILYNPQNYENENRLVELLLKKGVDLVEASAYMAMTLGLVRFRLNNIEFTNDGKIVPKNRIIGKVSRPEIAKLFMSPPPEDIVKKLLNEGAISELAARNANKIPMADAVTVEADSGGHTDQGRAYSLMPAMISLRDSMMEQYKYEINIKIGAAGGIGTPESAAAAFILGAEYITTGSINQCTVEAATSDVVKDMLQNIRVQDTEYCPSGDMFELGAKVQVMRLGTFFPVRANKLFELYKNYNSIDDIDPKTRKQIEDKYFGKTFEEVYEDVKKYYNQEIIRKAEDKPKLKMSLIFRWYFGYTSRLALSGDESGKVNYQVHCGPALGAFNEWVKGTEYENWRNRHVDEIAVMLMDKTIDLLKERLEFLA